MNVLGEDIPTDDQFMWAEDEVRSYLYVCLMCGLAVGDRDLHRDFHRWMNGTARKSEA